MEHTVFFQFEESGSGLVGTCYAQGGDFGFVRTFAFHLECDSRPPADAVAKRVSSLAGGDVFRQTGGDVEDPGLAWVCVGFTVGVVELSGVDWPAGTRDTEARLSDCQFPGGSMDVFRPLGCCFFADPSGAKTGRPSLNRCTG